MDTVSKEKRRKNMQAIRSQSQLENIVTKEIWNRGIRFRKNVKSLMGKPDIAIQKYKVVIFIDSCFWHACPIHGNRPKSNQSYWDAKLARNKKRDQIVNQYYADHGWRIKRIWEHEIKENLKGVIQDIVQFINEAKIQPLQ